MEKREWITFENEGQRIFGVLHLPKEVKGPVPAVLFCHGFGGSKIGSFRLFVRQAERLAKAGIASLRVDFRGSGDSEGRFDEVTLGREVSDALKALEYLRGLDAIDPERIGLLGRSFGGIVSVLALGEDKRCKSLVLWSAVFHSEPWEAVARFQEEQLAILRLNGHPVNRTLMSEFFAIDLEKELQHVAEVPLLHFHGHQDIMVDLAHAEQYQKVREQASALSRFVLLDHSGHDLEDPGDQDILLEETTKWFQTTL